MATGSRRRSSGPSEPAPRLTWRRLRLGALLLAGLTLAAVAVFFMEDVSREIGAGPSLFVAAAEARELAPGAAVWVAGVPAGRVTRIRFRPMEDAAERPVLIRAELRSDAARLLRADASVSVRVAALLEPAILAVDPGTAPTRLDLRDTLDARPLIDAEDILARADTLGERMDSLSPLARRLAGRLEEGPGSLASLRADTATVRRLAGALREGAALARAAGEGSGALLASDTALLARWERIRERSGRVAASGREAASLAREMSRLASRLSRLEGRLDSARGSLGRFLGDEALGRERRLLEARLDSVRSELGASPLRWLRFQLF